MANVTDREAAAELARRIGASLVDPSVEDEADRSDEDKSPGYADALMSEATPPVFRAVDLNNDDWHLICRALEAYAGGGV